MDFLDKSPTFIIYPSGLSSARHIKELKLNSSRLSKRRPATTGVRQSAQHISIRISPCLVFMKSAHWFGVWSVISVLEKPSKHKKLRMSVETTGQLRLPVPPVSTSVLHFSKCCKKQIRNHNSSFRCEGKNSLKLVLTKDFFRKSNVVSRRSWLQLSRFFQNSGATMLKSFQLPVSAKRYEEFHFKCGEIN